MAGSIPVPRAFVVRPMVGKQMLTSYTTKAPSAPFFLLYAIKRDIIIYNQK